MNHPKRTRDAHEITRERLEVATARIRDLELACDEYRVSALTALSVLSSTELELVRVKEALRRAEERLRNHEVVMAAARAEMMTT